MWSETGYLTYLRYLFRSTAVANLKLFSEKTYFPGGVRNLLRVIQSTMISTTYVEVHLCKVMGQTYDTYKRKNLYFFYKRRNLYAQKEFK